MNARRRLFAAASAAGALLALSGCQQPAPIVTVVSGGESVYSEAASYCFEGQSVQKGNCATRAQGTTELSVRGGQTVGIDVGKALLDHGWYIELSDPAAAGQAGQAAQPQRSEPQSGHYFTFTAPNLPTGSALLLTVRSLDSSEQPSGEWSFTLKPRR